MERETSENPNIESWGLKFPVDIVQASDMMKRERPKPDVDS
jgi:hypothetical protein